MKSVLIFVTILLVVRAHPHPEPTEEQLKEQISKLTKECAAKTNFKEENIQKLHAHDFTETENVKCYKKCVLDNSGLINEQGLVEAVLQQFYKLFKKDEAEVKKSIEKCQPLYKKETYDCDAAWEILSVFIQKHNMMLQQH